MSAGKRNTKMIVNAFLSEGLTFETSAFSKFTTAVIIYIYKYEN